ncbi:glycosyltransferase family 2 protein [Clostridium sp.]|uniref:glycosyltransferase family 2 protein n=1 Tax=Clostridium sp. TaxID=1506 RepID=UPI003996A830
MEKILLIVPAFNEEKSLPLLMKDINNVKEKFPIQLDTLIINDFSTDNTKNFLSNSEDINFINLPCNLGIGGAVQTGYKFAAEYGYDYAVQIDGDGQHNPIYLENLYKEIKKGNNFVIGSRFLEKKGFQSSFTRRIGINFFKILIKILTKETITDATSGFRMADREIIELFAKSYPSDYPEPDTLVTLLKKGYKVKETPVIMHERTHGESSIKIFNSIHYMIKVTLAIVLNNTLNERKI